MLMFETVKMPGTSACSKAEHYRIIGLALGPRAHQGPLARGRRKLSKYRLLLRLSASKRRS